MTLRKIALVGEPVLRQPAEELTKEELRSEKVQIFIDDLVETMRDANGAGLAANQVFTPWRICVIEVRTPNPRYPYKPGIPLTVLVNPHLEPIGDETFENYEGCLSVPDLRGVVKRHARARVRYLDRDGNPCEQDVAGVTAGTFQHELDHLDGKLFLDRVEDPTTLCTWKSFQRYHEAAFADRVRGLVETYGS
jgi:peptide deformylase